MLGDGRGELTLLDEGTGDRNRWYLFEREVESPHTTSFYVEAPEQMEGKAYDAQAFAEVGSAHSFGLEL